MEEALLNFISLAIEEDKAQGKYPEHLTRMDLSKKMDKVLNTLFKEGKINVGETLNDKYITVL
ncbi:hypothetical protein [Albibacterium profundi]|uniref:Uncharacterized protein n=1 Tax=Albibacterium profundi TaxID=3134906 RepID=A0ABV5CEX2_9SPHI